MTVRRAEQLYPARPWPTGLAVVALLCMAAGVTASACAAPPAGTTASLAQPATFIEVPEMTFAGADQPVPEGAVVGLTGLYGQYGSPVLASCRIEQNRMLCSRVQAEQESSRPQIVKVTGQVAGGQLRAESWKPVPWDRTAQRAAAQAHLDQAAPVLATYDWSQIARPDFAESSRRYRPNEAELTALPIELAGYDSPTGRIIWRAQAPDMPPQKPLVTRYPALYILTDPAGKLPSEMFVTIEGFVEE